MLNQKRERTAKQKAWLFLVPVLVLGGVKVTRWASVIYQDRLIIRNEYARPVTKLQVWFNDYPSHSLTFSRVQTNSEQWQPFDPNWGYHDSNRLIKVKGLMDNGKRVGSDNMRDAGISIRPLIGGSYLAVTIHDDGTITTEHN